MRDVNRYDKTLEAIGDRFRSEIIGLVSTIRTIAVSIVEVDKDNGLAYVQIYDGDDALPVPMTLNGIPTGMVKIVPAIDSLAVIGFMDGVETLPYFVSFSEIDEIIVGRGTTEFTWTHDVDNPDADELFAKIGDSSIRINKDVIEMNGGDLLGLIAIQAMTDRLNSLRTEINNIQSNISSHTHTVQVDGTTHAGSTTGTAYTTANITQFANSDYENDKITQG